MLCQINGETYDFISEYQKDKILWYQMNELAKQTFCLDFTEWYEDGYCTECYIPYTLFHNGRAVANVSVNQMDFQEPSGMKRYIQLGTVMTAEDFRGRGLSRFLMEKVLQEWKTGCESLYLFANENARDFYPKFGFAPADEYQFSCPLAGRGRPGEWRRLDMALQKDRNLLLDKYNKVANPFSRLSLRHNPGLLMFYALGPMRGHFWHSARLDAVAVAEQEENILFCYDIFCRKENLLSEMLSGLAKEGTEKIVLGFTPIDTDGFVYEKAAEGELLILTGKENLFRKEKLCFPELSHA